MKIQIWTIGKNHEPYVRDGIADFTKRANRYFQVEWHCIPVPKNTAMLSDADLKKAESRIILDWLQKEDYLVALDENGKQLSSSKLATFIQDRANNSVKRLVFLIGGAFGLDQSVLQRAQFTWSLSQLTFPHQLVRLLLSEQLYRAFSILRNEKYHHS